MKKILFAAMAALAITSCTQNEEIEAPAKKAEIKFNTAVSKASRATSITTKDFGKFKVYAYNTNNNYEAATEINALMGGIEFTKPTGEEVNADTPWTGGDPVYWPETDKVSFFAYSIETLTDVSWGSNPAVTVAPTLSYSVNDAIASQKDLIVAELMNKEKTEGNPSVSLNFRHALTKIGFKIEGQGVGTTYTIDKIVINAKSSGTYTFAADNSVTDTKLGEWGSLTTEKGYTIEPTTDITLTISESNTTDQSLLVADYTAMLIPQPIKDVTIQVFYKAEANGAILRDRMTTPETITFTTDNSTKWEPGQYVLYTLKLKGGDPISLKGTYTEAWTENSTDIE